LQKHFAALKSIPTARVAYKVLAENALHRLPVKDRDAIKRLFD